MIYGSVCSGIEAATVAWHPLGWKAAFYSEIDKFPSAVLAHHYPTVPNFGDFTTIKPEQHDAIDLLVGGTPCQSFSIAGLRGGLGDDRGNLALEYLRLADRARPRWLVWENVPGVLSSSGGRDFGAILGGMVELGYGVAYRVLDAQYCRVDGFWRAVPQRRRRVFVVGYLGDWRRAAAVLFERASLLGDNPPGRQTRERVAPTISARPTGGGGLGTDFDLDGGLIPSTGETSHCLNAGGMGRQDFETETETETETVIAHALRADGFDASEDGTGRGTPLVPIAFSCKDSGNDAGPIAPTLRAMTHRGSTPNGGGQVAIAIQERAVCENPDAGPDGAGIRDDGASYTLEARTVPQAVAFSAMPMNSGTDYKVRQTEVAQPLTAAGPGMGDQGGDYLLHRWAVRRLTPTECERLQGFPDNYTLIPWRKGEAPDGPRYKALGNSMAVNVMRWIGTRIQMVEDLGLSVQQAAE